MTELTFRSALTALSSSQKSRAGVSLYSRYVNRPLGRVFAAAAAAVGLGPNAVTALSALVTGAGVVLLALAPADWGTGVGVAALLMVGFALDSADGQVARLTGRGSLAGEWLDHVVDAGKMVVVHAGVLVAAWRLDLLEGAWLLLPLAYLFVAVVFFSALTIFDLLRRSDATPAAQRSPSTVRAIALLPADYGILALSFVLWGLQPGFFAFYGLLLLCTALIAGALTIKWFRTLSR